MHQHADILPVKVRAESSKWALLWNKRQEYSQVTIFNGTMNHRFFFEDYCRGSQPWELSVVGVERNRKARILVCSETYWMSSGCHILMFNWSFFSAEIFHWRYFVCFCSFARLHFRKFCIIWNRCREEASQYRHHQNFSPTSIHWIQKCECLLHEFEYQIMLSVSVFVSWNSSRKWNHYLNGYTVLLTVSAIKTRHY